MFYNLFLSLLYYLNGSMKDYHDIVIARQQKKPKDRWRLQQIIKIYISVSCYFWISTLSTLFFTCMYRFFVLCLHMYVIALQICSYLHICTPLQIPYHMSYHSFFLWIIHFVLNSLKSKRNGRENLSSAQLFSSIFDNSDFTTTLKC